MNVIQPKDLDGVTIDVKDGQISAIGGSGAEGPQEVILQSLELVENVATFHDGWGNWVQHPFGLQIDGKTHMIDRVARIKGTNWFVFGSSVP